MCIVLVSINRIKPMIGPVGPVRPSGSVGLVGPVRPVGSVGL